MDRLEARPIAGTEGAAGPFFSPDGQWIGFFAVRTARSRGCRSRRGPPDRDKCLAGSCGASWRPTTRSSSLPPRRASCTASPPRVGSPSLLTTLDKTTGEQAHLWPEVLPCGKAVIFTVKTAELFDEARIAVQPLGRPGKPKILIRAEAHARWAPSGHIVYARAGELLAVLFDLERLEVRGAPLQVAQGVSMDPRTGAAHFALSSSGTLAYVPGGAGGIARSLLWVDRRGNSRPITETRRAYLHPALSPDGAASRRHDRGSQPGHLGRRPLARHAHAPHLRGGRGDQPGLDPRRRTPGPLHHPTRPRSRPVLGPGGRERPPRSRSSKPGRPASRPPSRPATACSPTPRSRGAASPTSGSSRSTTVRTRVRS